MNGDNLAKTYVIDTNIVSLFPGGQGREKKGELNMRREFGKLLKTHIENMSVFRLSTMLMKTNELKPSLHDVDENKGGY
jgi:hypothetical protein